MLTATKESGWLVLNIKNRVAANGSFRGQRHPYIYQFERLHTESVRLGGIPLIAVLGGLGWTRVNDTLGPVIRDCDGRVFSVSNLPELLTVSPFPSLVRQG